MSRIIILTCALLLAVISTVFAQDSSYNQLNEVIVTANKYPQKQNTTGKVITVINKNQIEKNAGKTVTQLLNEQAGVTINGAFNNSGSVQSVYIRGASSGRALILIDGIPVNDPSMINNEFDLNFLSLSNIEQIEICKGAQSTLYGSDAIAGVINISTLKKDVTRPFNVKATVTGGNLNTWKANAQVYGKVNKLTYTANYAKLYTDGFSSAKDSSNEQFDADSYHGDILSARLQWQATGKFAIKTFVQHSFYKNDIDQGAFTDDKDYTTRNKSLLAGAGFTYKQNIVNITGNFQYNETSRRFINDSTDVPSYIVFEQNHYSSKTQFAELYALIDVGSGFTLLQGGDFRYGSMNNEDYTKTTFAPPYDVSTSAFTDTFITQASLYASLLYHSVNSKLNAEFGGRLNVHSHYGSNYTYTFNPSYAFNGQIRVFGSIATGFKAPTLYQLYSAYGDAALQPEKSVNYEVGIQIQNKYISTRAVYFYRRIRTGLDFDNFKFKYFNNIKQIVRGVEIEVIAHPVKALSIVANYTYLSPGETTQERTTFSKDTTYTYLLRRPKHNINTTIGYQFTKGLFISISGKYASRRFDAGGYGVKDVLLNDYFLLGADAEYKLNNTIKLFVNAQNITGKKFYDIYGYTSVPFLINGGIAINL